MKHLFFLLTLCTTMCLSLPHALCAQRLRVADFNRNHNKWEQFGIEMAKRFELRHLLTGAGGIIDDWEASWCFALTSSRSMTLEEARIFTIQLADSIWDYARCQPYFQESINESNREQPNEERYKKPLNRGQFGFKLAFWDAQTKRPLSPYLAQVNLVGNTILYFYADPSTQALLPPIKESLTEARQMCTHNQKD